jgi:serine/threonine protein kinase
MMADITSVGGIKFGTELNQTYVIDAAIGVGGMGEVFKGHNIQTGDPVAIKVVLPEFARDEMILELFRKEARILSHLSHEAIVRYHVFTLDRVIGRPYLAMEFADGPSLADKLKTGPLSEDDVAHLQKRLADGLQKAHEAGVIHRDMSPDNVILADGEVKKAKIIDFGIARSANVGGATLLGGSFAGKYNYVSPEQLGLFGADVTPKSDIYSLALVLAAALLGKPINMGGSQVEVIEKRRVVPDLSGIPARFQALLTAMLQPDPAARPQSIAEVRDWSINRSRRAVAPEDATVFGKPMTAAQAKPEPAVAPSYSPAVEHTAQSEPKFPVPLAIVGALAAVVALGVLGGMFIIDRGGEQQQAATTTSQPQPEKPPDPPKQAEVKLPPPPITESKSAALAEFVQTFDAGPCFFAMPQEIGATSAQISAFSDDGARAASLITVFQEQAGFEPTVTHKQIAAAQCQMIEALRKLNAKGAQPLRLVMANEGGTASIDGQKKILEAEISNIGPRSIAVMVVTQDGGVLNLLWKSDKTLVMENDTLRIKLPLQANKPSASGEAQPVLLVAIASPRNLFSVTGRQQYAATAMVPELLREAENLTDVSSAVGYFRY